MSENLRQKKILNEIPHNGKILDVGCNVYPNNIIHRKILEINKNCIGIDWQEGKGVDKVWDLNKGLPFKNDEFDCIFLGEIIEHLENPRMVLGECCRILKLNGKLILTTPNSIGLPYVLGYLGGGSHMMAFNKEMITENIEINGMKIEKFEYLNSFFRRNLLFRFIGFLIPRVRPTLFVIARKREKFKSEELLKQKRGIYKKIYKNPKVSV